MHRKKNVYSVGQINKYIKNMFEQDFMLHSICIKGEISNCKYHTSGHIYFTLKDAEGAISAVMFASYRRSGLSFQMKDGDKVVVTGSVEVYERDGKYQLYAKSVELDGAGNLYLQFEALKRELEEMGMFASEYKRPIPGYAKTVGIVTAQTGAAIQDIRNIARRRNPYVQLILYPAQVQGEGAAASVVNGIHALEQLGVDVMIVGRGGGSIEDLWAFNEEIVARAIFECGIPVISAVGHETDWTIADYVADLRAPTRSAAAELAVYDYVAAERKLQGMKDELVRRCRQVLDRKRTRLEHMRLRFKYLSPASRLNENRNRVADYESRLENLFGSLLADRRHKLSLLANTLEGYSPVRKLGGGYAFVETGDKKGLKTVSQVQKGDSLRIYLRDGSIEAQVTDRQEERSLHEERD